MHETTVWPTRVGGGRGGEERKVIKLEVCYKCNTLYQFFSVSKDIKLIPN